MGIPQLVTVSSRDLLKQIGIFREYEVIKREEDHVYEIPVR